MSDTSSGKSQVIRSVDWFASLYRKVSVRKAAMALKMFPALRSTQDDKTDWKDVEAMLDACGFEVGTVEIYRNEEMQTSWFIIRVVAKADS